MLSDNFNWTPGQIKELTPRQQLYYLQKVAQQQQRMANAMSEPNAMKPTPKNVDAFFKSMGG